MDIVWFNEKPKEGIATLSTNNITLNKAATTFFENAYSVMLGIKETEELFVIKPLTKEEAMRHDIANTKKYRITVRSSYSRISNKAFMEELSEMFTLDFEEEPLKYVANWNNKEKILYVNLRGSVK